MLGNSTVIAAAFGYIGLLFAIAFYGDRLSLTQRSRAGILIYPLSLAIYCTSWTFFGSIGLATRTSIEFLAIYIGPIIMLVFGKPITLRVIRLAKSQHITSIADFIAARYGKSQAVAATAAIIAIIGSVPYIALQLKAIASSLETILNGPNDVASLPFAGDIAIFVTIALALFAVLFGTRQSDATEHQHGLMLAVAAESIVKLVAFLAAGIFVTFIMMSPTELIQRAMKTPEAIRAIEHTPSIGNFLAMTLLSFFAILLLPRQFHVSVVENSSEAEVSRARWLFPLYLVAINIFVIPIALAGLVTFPFGAVDSDMFLLALPIEAGAHWMSIIVFVGGLSAATAMVIVECVALAIMLSNDIVMPLVLQADTTPRNGRADLGRLLLIVRRVAIVAIMTMAYFYYHALGNAQLAAIGLLSFAAVAQLAPAFFGGLIWRRGTAAGAIGGMVVGFVIWAYTLFLPSFIEVGPLGTQWLKEGLFGIAVLRPQHLFGSQMSPLIHGLLWSLTLNLLAYVALSFSKPQTSIERLQADLFVPSDLAPISPNFRRWRTTVTVQDLLTTVAQYLGPERANAEFEAFASANRITLDRNTSADFQLLSHAEHLIASSVGAASSRLVMSLLLRKRAVSAKAALKLLDDAHAALHFNREILQTALDHVRQGIAVFNRELQLICSNRQFGEMLSLPAHVAQIGIPLAEILEFVGDNPRNSTETREQHLRRRLDAYTTEGEPFLERLPGQNRVVEVRTNAMPGGGLVVTFSDITASFEAAEALERANATLERRVRERTEELTRLNNELALSKTIADEANISKTRFLAAASHDILQPLNAARLYVTSLVERQSGGENARLVDNIDESLEAIEEILGALLDISRLDAGAMTPSISSFRMSDLMRSLQVEFMPMAREKNLGFDLRTIDIGCEIGSRVAAPSVAEPDLERDQVHADRQGADRLPPARREAANQHPRHRPRHSAAQARRDLQGIPPARSGRADRARTRAGPVYRRAHRARARTPYHHHVQQERRLALRRDVAGGERLQSGSGAAERFGHFLEDADERHHHRLRRERPRHPRRHEDAIARLGRQCDCLRRSEAGMQGHCQFERTDHRASGRLSSRPRQRHRRDSRHPAQVRRAYSGDSDYGGSQPAGAGGGARLWHRRAEQAGEARNIARAAQPMAQPADGDVAVSGGGRRNFADGNGSSGRRFVLTPVAAGDLRGHDDCLGAAFDAQFLQDGRDVRLDGGFRHAEFIGDLLVEETLREHHQHPDLLRRQRDEPVAQLGHVGIDPGGKIDIGRGPDVAVHHLADRLAQGLDPVALRDKAGRAEFHRPADRVAIVARGHHHHRNRGILRPQIDQAGKAADARHRKIEQHEIDVGFFLQQGRQFTERTGFIDIRSRDHAPDRFPQRPPEERVVVGNHQPGGGGRRSHVFVSL